jgi:hypothetical protein
MPEDAATRDSAAVAWLLEGDAAVRWQAMRDLLDYQEPGWVTERDRVAGEGWGRRLLEFQDPEGTWRRSIYGKWNGTHYTLLLLRGLGLAPGNPAALRGAEVLLRAGLQPDGGINYGTGRPAHSETCITGMALAICAHFGVPSERLASLFEHLMRVQTPDGAWNCQWTRGSKHGSFHTTINVLEGLMEFGHSSPRHREAALMAQAQGREFLLAHRLFRSHTTGAVVNSSLTRFSFPSYWYYDVLRALDYFQAAGAPKDERLRDAIDLLQKRRQVDGSWLLQNRHPGPVWFELEPVSRPSRFNTLRCLRVLRWWQP